MSSPLPFTFLPTCCCCSPHMMGGCSCPNPVVLSRGQQHQQSRFLLPLWCLPVFPASLGTSTGWANLPATTAATTAVPYWAQLQRPWSTSLHKPQLSQFISQAGEAPELLELGSAGGFYYPVLAPRLSGNTWGIRQGGRTSCCCPLLSLGGVGQKQLCSPAPLIWGCWGQCQQQ